MTINSEIRKVGPFIGNGTASAFPFTFKVFQASDLEVVRFEVSTNVETVLTLNSQYTVTLNVDQDSNPGGTVTLIGGALASGYTLTLTSDVPYLQPTDLTNQGGFYPDVINDALDRATIQIQQLGVDVNRSIKVAVSSDVNTELPVPNANDLLGWDSTGTSLTNVDPSTLATVVAYATAYADVFIGDGVTTSWTLTRPAGSLYNLDVSIQGVTQEPVRDYTMSGTTITFTTAPFDTHRVLVKYKEGLPNYEGDSQDVRYVPSGPGAVATTVQAKLAQYINILDFGGQAGSSSFDNTPSLNDAIDAAVATNVRRIYFPGGTFYFNTKPNDITDSIEIVGTGKSSTSLIRNYSPTNNYDGLFNIRDGAYGCIFQDFTIASASGTTGGCLISMYKAVADATSAGDYSMLRGLNMTTLGTNTHYSAVYMDGSIRTGSAYGIRDVWISDTSIFGGTTASIYAKTAIALHITDCDTFPAGGTSGKIYLTGTSGAKSGFIDISGININGLNLTYTEFLTASIVNCGDIQNDSTATYCTFIGNATSVQENWTPANYINTRVGATFDALRVKGIGTAPSGTTNSYGFNVTPTSSGAIYLDALNGGTSGSYAILRNYDNTVYHTIIESTAAGLIKFPSIGTTASAANAYLDGTNTLIKSTSSSRYKANVEDLQQQYANKVLDFRPVWYRSLAEADRKDWSWYGLIAEEVAEIEPRLVHWKENENKEFVADGVQYERLAVLLLKVVQEQEKRIAKLEGK